MKPSRTYLYSSACPKARADMEKIGWMLQHAGYRLVEEPDGADFGVVFGCGFIDDAKRESIGDLLALSDMKAESRLGHVVAVGCLPQKYGRELARSMPEVDAFVGITALGMLPTILGRIGDGSLSERVWTEDQGVPGDLGEIPHRIEPLSSPWTRFLMISDGCDNACSYCAIPHMRGSLRSRPLGSVVDEVGELVRQGAVEVVLAGQDTASYGNDQGVNRLADLLTTLAREYPDTWFRLAYANPDNLEDGVAGVVASHANVCNYIDIPVQHASPAVLKAMGRKGPESKRRAIRKLREAVPDIALRTSVIVGFPGETEEDVGRLLDFLKSTEFDMAGVFAFSPQPGTPAAKMKGKVPPEVMDARLIDVVSFQEEISRSKMEAMVGREVEVLVEERDASGACWGRSQYDMAEVDRTIRLPGCDVSPGSLVRARLEAVSAPFEWTALLI